ncbi:nucleolar protein dao-5-like [Impatiens glandulifera]|uniref:nucleolar protein dao-5-like n=1 Tax=Impatiens glandulifera TaxID=253017 RepID=UPI001FB0C972|nr:nucleolar protein dao-5-like [Impatiens glandulifera]
MAESRPTIIVTRARGNYKATPMDMENLPSGASNCNMSGQEKYKSRASNKGRTGQEIKEGVSLVAIKNLSNSKLKPDADEDDDEEDEELVPTLIPRVATVKAAKPFATKAKTTAKPETSSKQKDMEGDSDDSDDDKDDSDDEEETPTTKKPIIDKKRANDSASKTLFKLRLIPLKRKIAHVATPHPVKQAGKTQAEKRTGDVFQPIPINTVRPINVDSPSPRQTEPSRSHETESASKEEVEVSIHSENSKSPNKNIDEIMADVGLNTSEVIVGVFQNIAKETEDDVSSRLNPADQEGNTEEKEPSGSAGNKSIPIDTTIQSAQDGPADSKIIPEGRVQVNKGKEVLIEDSAVKGKGVLQTGSQPEIITEAEVVISAEE